MDVWSPDGQTLVLPAGRFEGFHIVRSAEALTRLESRQYNDSVRVEVNTGTQLWHEFMGWRDSQTIAFRAGLSGQQIPFTYSIDTRTCHTPEISRADFIAINSAGRARVQ